jgi:hypothetical protein
MTRKALTSFLNLLVLAWFPNLQLRLPALLLDAGRGGIVVVGTTVNLVALSLHRARGYPGLLPLICGCIKGLATLPQKTIGEPVKLDDVDGLCASSISDCVVVYESAKLGLMPEVR